MQTFIDFLVNNYLWFLIISLVLVFALIGYLVDTSEAPKKTRKKEAIEPMNTSLEMHTNMDSTIVNTNMEHEQMDNMMPNASQTELLDDSE